MATIHIVPDGDGYRAELRSGFDPNPLSARAQTATEAIGRLIWMHPQSAGFTLSVGARKALGEPPSDK